MVEKTSGTIRRTIGVMTALCWATAANAVAVPVIDVPNLIANVVQIVELKKIQRALQPENGQTINYYTSNIDASITKNTDIDVDFTWIINHGDEDVPIPRPVDTMMDAILNGQGAAAYAANFRSADYYVDQNNNGPKEDPETIGLEGSRARKAANDALIAAIGTEQEALKGDTTALNKWMAENINVEGHGHQLQVSNSLAHTQVDQLMKFRLMMLASDAARAVEAQSAADREARALASSKAMRKGLSAYTHAVVRQPSF